MYELTGKVDISDIIAHADKARRRLAADADILFRLSQIDLTVKICDTLAMTAISLNTADIPDVSGIKKYVYLSRVLDRMNETEEKLDGFQSELSSSLTELYKTEELLKALAKELDKRVDELSSLEKKLNDILKTSDFLSENEKQLMERQINDMNMSQLVAEKNRQLIDQQTVKTSALISGIKSVDAVLLPLWRSQIAQAKSSCSADDIRRSFETGRVTAEKILLLAIKKG